MAQNVMGELLDELLGEGNYNIGIDEAAFYGPKLDIQMRNVHGKEDTLVTIQIDMLLAKKFGMEYTDSNDERVTPYIIHRTSMGCYERTLALLLEKYAGALPMWIAPEQVRLLPIGDEQAEYANKLAERLEDEGIRVTVDARNEKIGYKIRAAQLEKIPFMLVIGEKEMTEGSVAVRSRKTGDMGTMSADDFISFAKKQVADKVLDN
jgi:threonyl-tRNA synthetase